MPKHVTPLVPIELDKVRNLQLDFNALADIEEKTGRNMLSRGAWDGISASHMRVFLWAMLRHEEPTLTVEAVGAMLTIDTLPLIEQAFNKIESASNPESKADPTQGTASPQS